MTPAAPDWRSMFTPTVPLLEIVLRGTAVFLVYPWAHRLIVGVPLLLVDDGRIVWRNLRRELLTRSDLMEQLRAQGIADLGEVKQCRLEPDGRLSVLKREAADDNGPRQPDPKKI